MTSNNPNQTIPPIKNDPAFQYPYDRALLAIAEEEEAKARGTAGVNQNIVPLVERQYDTRRFFWRSPWGIAVGLAIFALIVAAVIGAVVGSLSGTRSKSNQNGAHPGQGVNTETRTLSGFLTTSASSGLASGEPTSASTALITTSTATNNPIFSTTFTASGPQ